MATTEKTIHYIAGLPRSGSTLLSNILCQNPRFYASGTSPLISLLRGVIQAWSASPEVQSQIDSEKDNYFVKFGSVERAIIHAWYSDHDEEVIFDKSRAWSVNWELLNQLFDKPKVILCIRDLRDVFASVEKQCNKSLLFGDQLPLTVDGRAQSTFNPDGVIGGPLAGIQDMLYRRAYEKVDQVFVWKYEEFCRNPSEIIESLYKFLGEPPFEHTFKDIERKTHENDAVYRYTYPHRGEGDVRPPQTDEWRQYIPQLLADSIRQRNEWFYNTFYPY